MELNKIQTKGGNHYLYDDYNKQVFYLHPLINAFLELGVQKLEKTIIEQLMAQYKLSHEEVSQLMEKILFSEVQKNF